MSELERLTEALACIGRPPGNIKSPSAILGPPEDLGVVLVAARKYADLLANGQRVEWCETHNEHAHGKRFCAAGIDPEARTCRIVSRLMVSSTEEKT